VMSSIAEQIGGLFIWQSAVSFSLGAGSTWIYYRWKANMSDSPQKPGFKRAWVIGLMAALLFCAIGWNTQNTSNKQEALARETTAYSARTNDCLKQMLAVLHDRSQYTADTDRLAAEERKALQDLLTNALDTNLADPVAKQAILTRYFSTIDPLIQQRMEIAGKRANNQYPDPTCGLVQPG
jgi:hypothetical protein